MGGAQAVDGAKEVLGVPQELQDDYDLNPSPTTLPPSLVRQVLGVPQELRDWIFDHVVRLKHRAQVPC
jgi:hypothetical protein